MMAWAPPQPRTGHPYFMYEAISAQPEAVRAALRDNGGAVRTAAAHLKRTERVLLSGIGTSWHACLVGELLLAGIGGLGHRVRAFHSFEFQNYWPAPDPKTGVIVVSHRGTKRFSLEALRKAKAGGGLGVAITGVGSGEGLRIADVTLRTVEQENSAAHTVSYTTALALLAALACEIGGDRETRRALEAIPDRMAALLGRGGWDGLAARYADRRCYYFVGGGPNTATAYEAALKMNEANHTMTVGMNCEQVLHGPWVAMESRDVVFLIAPPGPSYERCVAVARVAREIGAPVVGLVQEGDSTLAPLCAEVLPLPALPELLTPLPAVLPLQLLTYHLALLRGANPDIMRANEPPHGRARAGLSL
ncbi:MAG: SIS domain-containing protein [candidate division NC10 bacterium]|nr:SIS domain-containing protein [candidate division NC10 bacterium]